MNNKNILSVRGFQKHGIKDDKWTIRDKLQQYRGLLKLYERDKKLKALDEARLKGQIAKKLQTLTAEVKEYREILKEIQCGDRRRLHNILEDHRDLQLAYENHDPSYVYEAINRDVDLKRRKLDQFYYEKRKKMKEFFDLKLRLTYLMNDMTEQGQLREPDRRRQQIASLLQKVVANRDAAENIRTTYQTMIDILEKDTVYFTAIIDALKADRLEQGKVLMQATILGQVAAEDLDDTRQRYRKMSVDVWENMRIRESDLKNARKQVDDLSKNIQSLVRIESDIVNAAAEVRNSFEKDLAKQIKSLENTFDQVKDTLLARSYDELFTRLEEQTRQKTRLVKLLETRLETRDILLNKKKSAELILAELEHSMIATTGQYKANKKETLVQMEVEKKREFDYTKLRKSRGELLINIKSALQNMLAMMVCVRPDWGGGRKSLENKKNREKRKRAELKHDEFMRKSKLSDDVECQMEKFDPDPLILLAQVTKKAIILFGMSNYEMTAEEEGKAEKLYQNYVAEHRSSMQLERKTSQIRQISSFDHTILDSTVLTRTDVKSQSQQIVDAHTKLD